MALYRMVVLRWETKDAPNGITQVGSKGGPLWNGTTQDPVGNVLFQNAVAGCGYSRMQ